MIDRDEGVVCVINGDKRLRRPMESVNLPWARGPRIVNGVRIWMRQVRSMAISMERWLC